MVFDERIGRTLVKGQLLVTLHKGVKIDDLKPNSPKMQEGMKKEKRNGQISLGEIRNHGTHVAITIGGKADNNAGTAGVAPESLLMPLQALSYRHDFPAEDAGRITDVGGHVPRAMAMAVERNAAVMNLSLGGVSPDLLARWRNAKTVQEKQGIAAQFLRMADFDLKNNLGPFIDRANRAGTIIVVAAGNNTVPAEFEAFTLSQRVISVAATTREDKRADFSN